MFRFIQSLRWRDESSLLILFKPSPWRVLDYMKLQPVLWQITGFAHGCHFSHPSYLRTGLKSSSQRAEPTLPTCGTPRAQPPHCHDAAVASTPQPLTAQKDGPERLWTLSRIWRTVHGCSQEPRLYGYWLWQLVGSTSRNTWCKKRAACLSHQPTLWC